MLESVTPVDSLNVAMYTGTGQWIHPRLSVRVYHPSEITQGAFSLGITADGSVRQPAIVFASVVFCSCL